MLQTMPAVRSPVSVAAVGRDIPTLPGVIQNLPYPYGAGATGNAVQITLEKSPADLGYQVGDMVNLSILLEQHANTLWLPAQAVRQFEGRYFVIVQEGDAQRRVDVKVGIIEPDRIEIIEGLAEGQVVVAP